MACLTAAGTSVVAITSSPVAQDVPHPPALHCSTFTNQTRNLQQLKSGFSQSAPRLRSASLRTVGPRCNSGQNLEELVKEKNSQSPIVVYSKSWCPYCGQVKALFKKLGVEIKAIELDGLVEEQGIQQALYDLTGQSTVPNVFIGGRHVGGCDDTMELNRRGELMPLLVEAGVVTSI